MSELRGPSADAAIGVAYSTNQLGRARELFTLFYVLRRSVRFYPVEHPATLSAVRDFKEAAGRFHSEGVDVQVSFFEGELLFGQHLLPEESLLFDQLIREMSAIGVGTLTITRGVDAAELTRAAGVLSADSHEVKRDGGIIRMIEQANVPHVIVGEVKVYEQNRELDSSVEELKESYEGAIELMREIDTVVRRNQTISSTRVKGAVRSLVDNVLSNRSAMIELSGLKSHDEYTFYHSANVAILSLALGSAISNDYRFLSSLGTGALLHDVGKLKVDASILNKPGSLSAEEWAAMRMHPVYGAQEVALVPGLDRSSLVIILEHHLRYDGTGYPARVPRRPQRLASRVVAVADAFDAMTSRRSYSEARVQDEAIAVLAQSAGTALDPALTRLFVSLMGVYPPRSVVRLSDGSTGIVLRPGDTDATRPVVRIIADKAGTLIEPRDVDLASVEGLDVSRCIDSADLNIDIEEYV